MCNRCDTESCGCDVYNGKCVLYTGIDLTSPFELETRTNFNDFVVKIMDYLSTSVPGGFTRLTFTVTPVDATIKLNGVVRNSIVMIPGSTVNVEITKAGYVTETDVITVPSSDTTYNYVLQQQGAFVYYWGEIGNIYAPSPSDITESVWDSQIKPNTVMTTYNESTLRNSYEEVATGDPYQWWIAMIPTSSGETLVGYSWMIFDELVQDYVTYTQDSPVTGTVTLDGIVYEYSAIRPTVTTKIKFTK